LKVAGFSWDVTFHLRHYSQQDLYITGKAEFVSGITKKSA